MNNKYNSQIATVLSCEHGGNHVPEEYFPLFIEAREILISHLGWDPGALALLQEMAKVGVDYTQYSETTRLLIDLNRSLFKRTLFSEYTRTLGISEKQKIIKQYYEPFREDFRDAISDLLNACSFVFHVSVHSFTPVIHGEFRNADIGLLYNPEFGKEKELAIRWRKMINAAMPQLRVRMNYPYTGKNGGHVFALRQQFGHEYYAGIELEINQKYAYNTDFMKMMSGVFEKLLAAINFTQLSNR